MSPDNPLSSLPRTEVPASLLATVERTGARLLRPPVRRPATMRDRVINVAMTGFCLVHVIWIARIVHLLP